MRPLFFTLALSTFSVINAASGLPGFPPKIYGVNLGSWLVLEPWMLPQEWADMGGERCNDCSTCAMSEFAFVEKYGQETSDRKFDSHWETWFNQPDVNQLKRLGINTVRIPLGYWLIEDLVNREEEFYPKGGLPHLRRGLKQLQEAGIVVLLDHHALPGVQTANQMFAGRCTQDVQFYTPYNFHRALVWTAVMATLSHVDQAFRNVIAIQAVNEPEMDATKTPGYGDFQKNFVQVIRAVEFLLGIHAPGLKANKIGIINVPISLGFAKSYPKVFNKEVREALKDATPILKKLGMDLNIPDMFSFDSRTKKEPLTTTFMDINWQRPTPERANPADAAIGPQAYDNHLYYSFGGVAEPNEEAYLTHVCNLDRIEKDAELGNSPLFFGEWGLSTQFNATDEFLYKWADAQKWSYGKDAGWLFWNFKIEESKAAADYPRQWSYFEGVRRGYLTKNPAEFHDEHVCDKYINPGITVTTRTVRKREESLEPLRRRRNWKTGRYGRHV